MLCSVFVDKNGFSLWNVKCDLTFFTCNGNFNFQQTSIVTMNFKRNISQVIILYINLTNSRYLLLLD